LSSKEPRTLVAVKIKASETTRQVFALLVILAILGVPLAIIGGIQLYLCKDKDWRKCLTHSRRQSESAK
jgi:hypothetical protein